MGVNTMPNIFLRLCIYICAATPSAAEPRELTLLLRTDKSVYEFTEDISVTVSVENHSSVEYILVQAPFDMPCVRLLEANAPTGQKLSCSRRYGFRDIDARIPTIAISPGETYSQVFNLSEHFYYQSWDASPHNFDQPGTYQLRAVYRLEDWERRLEDAFAGPLESKTVEFAVKPLEGKRLEEVLRQLASEDAKIRAGALQLIRRGRRLDTIDILSYLDPRNAEEVRREAASAVMDSPDEKAWEAYVGFLKDRDATVGACMAEALGKLKAKAAGNALYEVTDPEKYPASYAAAFRALIQIGDPRVKEVAERLSKTAPSDHIRNWAKRVAAGENTEWP